MDGESILKECAIDIPDATPHTSTLEWPQQQKPHTKSWHLWYHMLTHTVCNEALKLTAPLRKWIRLPHIRCDYHFSPSDATIYHVQDQWWTKFPQYSLSIETLSQQPDATIPLTDMKLAGDLIECTHPPSAFISQTAQTTTTSFQQYCATLQPWKCCIL
eukprot:652963-Ditylum_brightwellii.AAC.1